MIAVDSNILVYWQMASMAEHTVAIELVSALAGGRAQWAIPWTCIYESYRIVTHRSVFDEPLRQDDAHENIRRLIAAPTLQLISETSRHDAVLGELLASAKAAGNMIYDARIAAVCIENGVTELLTNDRDFGRFAKLKTRNPFKTS